jgi:hypothetical protein
MCPGVEVFTQCLPGSHRSHAVMQWYGGACLWILTAAARSVPGDVQVSQQWSEGINLWVEGVGGFTNSWYSLPGALIDPRLRSRMLSHLSSARLSYFEIKRCCMSSAG